MENTLTILCFLPLVLFLPCFVSSSRTIQNHLITQVINDSLPSPDSFHHYDEKILPPQAHVESHGRLDSISAMLYGEAYFQSFIRKYGKVYSGNREYVHRLGIFKNNLMKALKNQVLDPTAIHGITPFSDLSEEEFTSRFLGLSPITSLKAGSPAPLLPVADLPSDFDWREYGAVTDVKNQGKCGSCWAFATTGAIESSSFLATGKLINLSEQQLVDCDRECDPADKDSCDSGCSGGLMTTAYGYVMKSGGLMDEKEYPYTGIVGPCKFDQKKVAVKVANFTSLSLDEDQLAANLVKHGPLAVGLNAAFMQTYIGGVSCPLICSKQLVNHGVLIVGYGERGFTPLRLGYKPYWIIKNSWGGEWGEHGYYKLCRGHGECGVNTMVSTVQVVVKHKSLVEEEEISRTIVQ